MMFTAAVVLISFVSCISEQIRPPEHQSLQHLTFLEVLHVEQGLERGVEAKTDTTLRRMPSLANLVVQGPGMVLQALTSFAALPDALEDKYKDDSALGSGTFGVTFLATRKADNQKVAVKVFKVGKDWATPGNCRSAECRALIGSSASECLDTQRIHSADTLDSEASEHVVNCFYDGITGHTAASQPYYIEMSFAGRDDVDKWWGKKLKEHLVADADYVQHLKSVAKGVYLGLKFMAESKGTNKWVHMDLKPQNMVINEDTGQTVIVDMGTVVCQGPGCTSTPRGTTAIFRPPEVPHLSLFHPGVEWQSPVWSFDVHSAALSILGMATDGNSGLVMPDGTALHAVPVLPYMLTNEVQTRMANWRMVKEVVDCGREIGMPGTTQFLNGLLKCTNDNSVVLYKMLFDQRLQAIRKATGDKRKAAWASLVHCRTSKRFATALYPLPDLQATKVPKFFWTLIDDWMKTGFDEVLLKALSTTPDERPKPSEILEAQWFNADKPKVSGTSVEFTCPDYFTDSQAYYQICAGFVSAILLMLTACVCCCGTCSTCCCQIPAWKWASVWAGILVVATPFFAFFLMNPSIVIPCVFLLLMVPLGLAMICLQPVAERAGKGSAEKQKKVKLGIIGLSAVLALGCSLCVFSPTAAVALIPPDLTFGPIPVGGRMYLWAGLAASLNLGRPAVLYTVISGVSVMIRGSDARDVSTETGSTVELQARV
ncbi:SAMS2 [Symbiodinium sp. CCMP2592]|nr:SAMS2 [Symbiodinium sp. CCMP2592]